ncbi:hypothetical protein GCM10010256_01440 [Streptomyces coeruleorubidus]|nr:hypothetical protein GCM10010256_01440 [Streptomyces coeruleorubidus]
MNIEQSGKGESKGKEQVWWTGSAVTMSVAGLLVSDTVAAGAGTHINKEIDCALSHLKRGAVVSTHAKHE